MISYQRTDAILRKKFLVFLVPSILTSAATSLNFFLDSLVIAQTLGADAMALVNMASPVTFVMSAVYCLLGGGGSAVYAFLKGRLEKDKAAGVLSLTMLTAALVSAVIALTGFVFADFIALRLSGGLAVSGQFTAYIRVLLAQTLLVVPMQTLLMFYPAEGLPQVATVVNIVVNVVNIIFDYVFTACIPLDLKGCAFATLAGYLAGLLVILAQLLRRKYRLSVRRVSAADVGFLKEMVEKGAAACLNQVGFCIKISFSNYVAIRLAGAVGVTVFSACFQTVSMISIVLCGILHTMTPMVSAIYGMRDYNGIRLLMNTVLKLELALSLAFFAFVELWPGAIFYLYNVSTAEALELGIPALRVFALMYLFRQTVLVFLYYYQTIGAKVYSVVLSLVDGFAGIIAFAAVLCPWQGIGGLWAAYPVTSAVMLAAVLLIGRRMPELSRGKYADLLMLPAENGHALSADFSLSGKNRDISAFVETLQRVLLDSGLDGKQAALAAVACEEACVSLSRAVSGLDVLVYADGGDVVLNFLSVGEPVDLLSLPRQAYSSVDVLFRIAKEVRYDYVIGMNQTRVRIRGEL